MRADIKEVIQAAESCCDDELEVHIAALEKLLDEATGASSRSKLLEVLAKLQRRIAWRGSYPGATAYSGFPS